MDLSGKQDKPFAKLCPQVALHEMKTAQENSCRLCMGFRIGGKARRLAAGSFASMDREPL
jgi:hypothetical protein